MTKNYQQYILHISRLFFLLSIFLLIFPQLSQSEKNQKNESKSFHYKNLTDGSRVDFYPQFSVDGKQIIFSSKPIDGDFYSESHLWIMDSDGKNRREITSGKGMDIFPTFTPDGKKIIFVSNRLNDDKKTGDICSINADGSNFTRIANLKGKEYSPQITVDGKNIIYVSEASKTNSVFIMDINGNNSRRLTSGGNGDHFASMKPDNKEIIFSSTRVGLGDVWTIDPQKNIYNRLTYKNVMEGSPAVNHDGTRIAYMAKEGGMYDSFNGGAVDDKRGEDYRYRFKSKNMPRNFTDGIFDLWIMDIDGSNKTKITQNLSSGDRSSAKNWDMESGNNLFKLISNYHITWNPAGTKIALTTWDKNDKEASSITVVNLDENNLNKMEKDNTTIPEYTLIREMELTNGGHDDLTPSFSPDGETVIFASNKNGNWDIWSINVNGEELKQISSDPADELSPVFNPDGNEIAYIKPKAGINNSFDLWLMSSSGTNSKQITKNIPVLSYPAWSPDGKKIAFVCRTDKGAEIWTHNLADSKQKKIASIWSSYWDKAAEKLGNNGTHSIAKKVGNNYPYKEFLYSIDYNSAGDKIAFESNRTGNVEIWTMNIDGTNLKKITKGEHAHWNPSFSPDGKKIAYTTIRTVPQNWSKDYNKQIGDLQNYPLIEHTTGGSYEWPDYNIWIKDIETGKNIIITGEEQIDWNPVWSPKGRMIAYVTNRSGEFENFSIWLLFLK